MAFGFSPSAGQFFPTNRPAYTTRDVIPIEGVEVSAFKLGTLLLIGFVVWSIARNAKAYRRYFR